MSRFRPFRLAVIGGVLLGVSLPASASSRAQAPAPARRAACSLAPTNGLLTRTLGGHVYDLFVPAGMTGSATLLLSLHGFGEPRQFHEAETGWAQFAVGKNLIVAWPQGVGLISSWNFTQGSADVAFLRALVADISATWCVDRHHVHAEGISNGALMVERLACDAADLFASVAPDAGGPPNFTGSPCKPSRPIGVGIFESLFDPLSSPFVAGIASRQLWLGLDGCPTTPSREPGVLLEASTYGPCHGGVQVVYRVYLLETHNFPVGADHTDILNRMWALFRDNPLP